MTRTAYYLRSIGMYSGVATAVRAGVHALLCASPAFEGRQPPFGMPAYR